MFKQFRETERVSYLVSWCFKPSQPQVHQGWKQTSIHLKIILHRSQQTANFFKIHITGYQTQTFKEM